MRHSKLFVLYWFLCGLFFSNVLFAAPLNVFVSVLPQKTFVERIGGEQVNVEVMVQPGHSPHTYEPTPRQVSALAESDLYIRIGVPFEDAWIPRIQATNPNLKILDLREGISLRRLEAHHHHDDDHHHHHNHSHSHHHHQQPTTHHHHSDLDPHIWTSPRLVRIMAERIRDQLSLLDPDHADYYRHTQQVFDDELAILDRHLRARLEPLQYRRFLVYHPAWGYFADDYGIEQIAIEHQGKEPGARRLNALINQAREVGARVVFVQPQFDRRSAETVARAINGRVEVIDPLALNYAENLLNVAELIATASGH